MIRLGMTRSIKKCKSLCFSDKRRRRRLRFGVVKHDHSFDLLRKRIVQLDRVVRNENVFLAFFDCRLRRRLLSARRTVALHRVAVVVDRPVRAAALRHGLGGQPGRVDRLRRPRSFDSVGKPDPRTVEFRRFRFRVRVFVQRRKTVLLLFHFFQICVENNVVLLLLLLQLLMVVVVREIRI